MIEKAVIEYLLSIPVINTKLGGKLYYRQAPTTAKMPWAVVTNSGGMRTKDTQPNFYSSAKDTLTLYVDDTNQYRAYEIAADIVNALENYRGTMGAVLDTHFRCGSIRDLNGFQGNYRMLVTVYCTYRISVNNPN